MPSENLCRLPQADLGRLRPPCRTGPGRRPEGATLRLPPGDSLREEQALAAPLPPKLTGVELVSAEAAGHRRSSESSGPQAGGRPAGSSGSCLASVCIRHGAGLLHADADVDRLAGCTDLRVLARR